MFKIEVKKLQTSSSVFGLVHRIVQAISICISELMIFYFRCCSLGVLSTLLLLIDISLSNESEAVMSLPAWKLAGITTAVVSISLKILSTLQVINVFLFYFVDSL